MNYLLIVLKGTSEEEMVEELNDYAKLIKTHSGTPLANKLCAGNHFSSCDIFEGEDVEIGDIVSAAMVMAKERSFINSGYSIVLNDPKN